MPSRTHKPRTTNRQHPGAVASSRRLEKLGVDATRVMATRLANLPWQWALAPHEAHQETRRMVNEKQAAAVETWLAACQSPWHFWADMLSSGVSHSPEQSIQRALTSAGNRLIAPSGKRVRANIKRLGAR